MAQGAEFPLRKPPGFHYDFFLLGITTLIAGLLGLPAPNGLIPQAPIHTASLLIYGKSPRLEKDEEDRNSVGSRTRANSQTSRNEGSIRLPAAHGIDEIPIAVVEQRVSNLAQGSLCLVLLSGPFLHHVLALIPRGVLAGLLYVSHAYPRSMANLWIKLVHGSSSLTGERNHEKDTFPRPRQNLD